MHSFSPDETAAPRAEGAAVSLSDVISGIAAGFLRDGEAEVNRGRGASGSVDIRITVRLEDGRPVWSRGSVAFERQRFYKEASGR
jgi:hypothetical protein